MSVINPNEASKSWRTQRREPTVILYLSGADGDASSLIGARVGGFALTLALLSETDRIDPADLGAASAAVIQVNRDQPESVARFQQLAAATRTPLIAAAFEPPLAFVRSLIRAGAHDVVPLPLDVADLEAALAPIRDSLASDNAFAQTGGAKVVSIIKSVGGVGATALLTQLGIRFCEQEAAHGRQACLIDFDVQFGDAAFQLGLQPNLSLADLIDAGARIDGDMLRATMTSHSSGLQVLAAPPDVTPLESLSSDQLLEIVELAAREFGTVFVDLPTNWTNWSLSILARSDVVLLVTEMTVASLSRARRQLDLIRSQELDENNVRVVVNRFEKGLLKTVRMTDVRDSLGRDVAFTIANEHALMSAAIDRGIPIVELKRKSTLMRDLDLLDAGIAAALGLER
ncbi:pilus assembly protein CpaE [Sphingomonas sp.]|uniref:AAA family ATPase n=1 Tax=Sphingomonas sp. TaxID=28214 RepID=UPI00286C5028|nr:pilus assembly protein CpaE [Sphingomonas sp.]